MEPRLRARLQEAGVDPAQVVDPRRAWLRLRERLGDRATLIDRYALEAAARGISPGDLSDEDRRRLAREVLEVRYPGIELLGSGGGDPVDVVPCEREWPGRFAAWRDRLEAALAGVALRIEHIGSTAVPGLAAKPAIDIQVSVSDVEEERSYVPAMEALGTPLRMREPGHRYFRPAARRPRVVQIHFCDVGGEWERRHMLFRDFLRSHASVRDAYAVLKEELADRYRGDRLAYNEAKTTFILDALDEARSWAERTGWYVRDGG